MKKFSEALAKTIMVRYPDPDSFPYRSWCYPQGLVLWGIAELWQNNQDPALRDYVLAYADSHVAPDGNISGFSGESMDDMMAGCILAWALGQTGEKRYRLACERIYAAFSAYPRTASGAFWHSRKLPGEFWVDGVFMGQMFLLEYAAALGDEEACWEETVRQVRLARQHLAKDTSGLLLHAYCEDGKAAWADDETGQSTEVWSEGLGWYALILARAVQRIPAGHPLRAELAGYLAELLAALLPLQDAQSGLWYQVVDKPDAPDNWCDTSGSAMFGYALLVALRFGIVPQQPGQAAARRAYHGLLGNTTTAADDLLDIHSACDGVCVQTGYAQYIGYPQKVNAKEAVGAALWFSVAYEHGAGL